MHDNQLQSLTGWPDVESAPSVVRCIKQSMVLTSPGGAPFPGNWDAYIALWPWLDNLLFNRTTTRKNSQFTGPTGVPVPLGGLQAWAVGPGGNLDITTNSIGQLFLDPAFSQGVGRLIGAGIEVVNTTADLTRQGLVTVFRQAEPKEDASMWSGIDAASKYEYTGQVFRRPPDSSKSALLYPGSRQWKAADGCYIVVAFNGQDNPSKSVNYVAPVVILGDDDLAGDVNTAITMYPTPLPALAGGDNLPSPATKLYPIHMSGCIFSGLSPTTSLQVNLNLYYESFPAQTEQSILVLASPSATYDPVALGILSRAVNTLPVGVQASQNPEGEWFYDLASLVSEWAPKVGELMTASGIPGAGLIGSGLGQAAKMAQGYMTAPGNTAPTLRNTVAKEKKKQNAQAAAQKAANAPSTNTNKLTKAQRRALTQKQQAAAQKKRTGK